jgi:hypothetical protein
MNVQPAALGACAILVVPAVESMLSLTEPAADAIPGAAVEPIPAGAPLMRAATI